MAKKCIIITTINRPTEAILKFSAMNPDWITIIVADVKTPIEAYKTLPNLELLDLDTQKKLFPKLSKLLPLNHYTRKNIGYLYAIKNGFEVIAESDDDTIPYDHWGNLNFKDPVQLIVAPAYPNIYKLYTDRFIWPRGFPLDQIRNDGPIKFENFDQNQKIGLWQGLVDGDPDVDAIFRLTSKDYNHHICFEKSHRYYAVNKKIISPGNSQNVLWVEKAIFYHLYLPATVTFRYCDILRSYIAQYGMWAHDMLCGITPATTYQVRNFHNLLDDFQSEVPVYLNFHKVIKILDNVNLEGNLDDLCKIYEQLRRHDIVRKQEVEIVQAWIAEVGAC